MWGRHALLTTAPSVLWRGMGRKASAPPTFKPPPPTPSPLTMEGVTMEGVTMGDVTM